MWLSSQNNLGASQTPRHLLLLLRVLGAPSHAETEGEEHHPAPSPVSPTLQCDSPSGGTHCCSSLAHFTDDSGLRKHSLSPLMK